MGVAPANVAVGEGVDALLGYLVRLLIAPGDVVVTSEGAYPTFNYHVTGYGGVLEKTPYLDDREDPAALFARAGQTGAKLVYVANPDNPMGTWHAGADIAAALADLPEGCLLLLDEAYIELAPPEAVAEIAADDPRVLRMRSFSKAYGMAGARVGYAVGAPELIGGFDRIRKPLRREPHGPSRSAGRAGGCRVARADARQGRARPATKSSASPRRAGCPACRRQPILSPSTAARTAHSPRRSSTGFCAGGCLSECRSLRRRIAASG